MDAKQKKTPELIPSLEFLHAKLTAITTADEKTKFILFTEIEQNAKILSQLLQNSTEGKQLRASDREKFDTINQFVKQVLVIRREKSRRLAEAQGAKIVGGVSGSILGLGGGAVALSGESQPPPHSSGYGSSGNESSSFSAWQIGGIAALGLFAGMGGLWAVSKYCQVGFIIRIEGGRRLIIDLPLRQLPPAAENLPQAQPLIDVDVIGFLELVAASAVLLKAISAELSGAAARSAPAP